MGDPTFEIVRVSRSCDLCFDDFCRCCFRTRSDMIPSLQRPQLACSSEACRCWLGACRLLKSRLQRSQVIIFGVSPDVLGEPAAVAKRSSTLFLSCAFIANTHPFDSCKCLCADLVREGLRYCSQDDSEALCVKSMQMGETRERATGRTTVASLWASKSVQVDRV